MFVLYAGAMIILPLEIPVMLKFISIILFTGTMSYLIYEFIIRRISLLKPLFGLKWNFNRTGEANIRTKPAGSTSNSTIY
jgi:hypothetical protein